MSTVEIPLSGGMVAIVDAADAERVRQYTWYASRDGSRVYVLRHIRRPDGGDSNQSLHQFLTGYRLCDHRNGDGLDNRSSNLREATPSQNMWNRRRASGASGFKGVSKRGRNWRARIKVCDKEVYLGMYAVQEDAARAYDMAARELHGEFATLNFPLPGERAA